MAAHYLTTYLKVGNLVSFAKKITNTRDRLERPDTICTYNIKLLLFQRKMYLDICSVIDLRHNIYLWYTYYYLHVTYSIYNKITATKLALHINLKL